MILNFIITKDGRTRTVSVSTTNDENWKLIKNAWDKRDKKLSLTSVSWNNDENPEASISSKIKENWTIDSLARYIDLCNGYGESYFLLCEVLQKRDAEKEWNNRGQSFTSLAEAGDVLAEEFLGIPTGVLKYLDATRLAKDVMNGTGPKEIPDNILIMSNPMGNPVYLQVIEEESESPTMGM